VAWLDYYLCCLLWYFFRTTYTFSRTTVCGDMINRNSNVPCGWLVVVVVQGEGPGRRDRQVLVVAVGSAVAQVQPAGPGLAARRVRHARRVGRNPQSGKALRRFTCQSLSSGLVSAPSFFFLLQACSSVHMLCV